MSSGRRFDLSDDTKILRIRSPKSSVGGPYAVVYKHLEERWVIVAMDWEGKPGLGIRWFWGNGGNPFSSAHPTWLVIPSELCMAILNGLPLDLTFRRRLEGYLGGEVDGESLS